MSEHWKPAPENTLESLRHGITNTDGIEFDIRMTIDNQLIIHHDPQVSINSDRFQGRKKWVEEWTLDELKKEGFCSLDDVLNDKVIIDHWREKGKMVCLEFKRPHPLAQGGRRLFAKSKLFKTMSDMMILAESKLNEYRIPNQNSVFYAFYPSIKKSIESNGINRNWAELTPSVPSFGNTMFKRLFAYPQYLVTPFSRLVKKHRMAKSSMIPCALDYFTPLNGRALIGRRVGFKDKQASYISSCQKGMPVYVWPARLEYESHILNTGLTGLTDNTDTGLTWLPSGDARWMQPATLPLDINQRILLDEATEENHVSIIRQLKSEVPTWLECDNQRKLELINLWRNKWQWQQESEDILSNCQDSPPWQSIKLIGHRGSGKTSRPVIE